MQPCTRPLPALCPSAHACMLQNGRRSSERSFICARDCHCVHRLSSCLHAGLMPLIRLMLLPLHDIPHVLLQDASGKSVVEDLFGIGTTLKLKCEESDEELQVRVLKDTCQMQMDSGAHDEFQAL
eukprot:1160884-Pelagomonas_calceolata.AAC.26